MSVIGECDEQSVSYAGLDPEVHQSGETEVRGSISKESSAPLRWTLVQSAHVAVKHDEYLGNFYTRLKEKKNHQIAIVATARKLLVSIFHMLTRKEPVRPTGGTCVKARHTSHRWSPHRTATATADDISRLVVVGDAVPGCWLVVFSIPAR